MTALATRIDNQDIAGWADRITACWRQSVEAVITAGRLIAEAKAALPHGEFRALCRDHLPFGERTAQRLMAVAADARLSNPTHASHLPPSWMTLYELTRLDDEQFTRRIADGTIRPDMDRKDISTAVKQQVRKTRELLLGTKMLTAPKVKAGVIVEDYEWDHETWSDKGRDRAAENHYPVSRDAHTAAEIVARTKERFECAAADCILWMWATIPHLAIAIDVLRLRGFDYRSHYIWRKDRAGTGYWSRARHEILLIGVKGDIMCPALGTQWDSVIDGVVQEHSRKPDAFLEMIEQYYPTLPKVELNARRARPGWIGWGLDAEQVIEAPSPAPVPVPTSIPRASPLPPADFDTTIPAFLRRVGV